MPLQAKLPYSRSQPGTLHYCNDCDFSTRNKTLFKRHTVRCPGKLGTGNLPMNKYNRNYQCRRCDFESVRPKVFLAHQVNVHSARHNIYSCDICDYASKFKAKTLRHRKMIHRQAPIVTDILPAIIEPEGSEESAQPPPPPPPQPKTPSTMPVVGSSRRKPTVVRRVSKSMDQQISDEEDGDTSSMSMSENNSITAGEDSEDGQSERGKSGRMSAVDKYIDEVPDSETGDPYFKCKMCTFGDIRKLLVNKHVRTNHFQSKRYRCSVCEFATNRKIEFFTHRAEHAGKTIYRCDWCQYATEQKPNLERHLTNHSLNGPFKCEHCSYSSTTQGAINRHLAHHHCDLEGAEGGSHVDNMEEEMVVEEASFTERRVSRKRSVSSISARESMLENSVMDSTLDSTMEEEDEGGEGSSSIAERLCVRCGWLASSQAGLASHMARHTETSIYGCQLCWRKYKRSFDLNRHMIRKHNMKLKDFVAQRLQEAFLDQPLNLSVKRARLDQDEPLDLSKKQPTIIEALAAAQGEGNLNCTYCPYVAKWSSDLRRHLSAHSIDKKYKCQFCFKRYKFKSDLLVHVRRVHKAPEAGTRVLPPRRASETEFKCESDQCAFSTKFQHVYESHMKQHHPNRLFKCPNCLFSSNLRADLKKHCARRHPDDKIDVDALIPISDEAPAGQNAQQQQQAGAMIDQRPNGDGEKTESQTEVKCPHCPFTAFAPSKLKSHIAAHENLKPYKCPECGKRSNWIWDIRKHIRAEHPGRPQEVVVLTAEEAKETLPLYLTASPHKSAAKTKLSGSPIKEEKKRGRRSYYGASTDKEQRYKIFRCQICGKRSNWGWDIRKHMRSAHSDETTEVEVMTLEEAMATLDEYQKLNAPGGATKSPQKPPPPPPPPPKPPSPVASPKPVRGLKKHLAAGEKRPYKCSACYRRSNWRWDINKHIRTYHPGLGATCLTMKVEDDEPGQDVQLKQEAMEEGDSVMEESLTESPAPSASAAVVPAGAPDKGIPKRVRLPGGSLVGTKQYDHLQKKIFKCSICPYRSNWRSDIHRHRRRMHAKKANASVLVLSYEEAEATLQEYNKVYVKKKFCFRPGKSLLLPKAKASAPPEEFKEPEIPEATREGPTTRKKKMWKCSKCGFKNRDREIVLKHYATHSLAKPFKCAICGKGSTYQGSLYRHLREVHKSSNYLLCIPGVAFGREEGEQKGGKKQKVETKETEGGGTYRCKLCGASSNWKKAVYRHIRDKHNLEEDYHHLAEEVGPGQPAESDFASPRSPQKKHRCDMCPYRSSKLALIKIHKSYHTPQEGNNFKCSYCNYYVCAQRLLHQHTRLHEQLTSPTTKDNNNRSPVKVSSSSADSIQITSSTEVKTYKVYQCEKCPYVSRSKSDFLYHKQFHRPKATSVFKCPHCPYWVQHKRLMKQHTKVHDPNYRNNLTAINKLKQKALPTKKLPQPPSVQPSPAKSEGGESTISTDDVLELASIKQEVILSKIYQAALTDIVAVEEEEDAHEDTLEEEEVKEMQDLLELEKMEVTNVPTAAAAGDVQKTTNSKEASSEPATTTTEGGPQFVSGYVVNKTGHLLANGSYRKMHKCQFCPYTNVRATNLKMHEKMHGFKEANKEQLQCPHCDYSVGNKGLLTHHLKVHSATYDPLQELFGDTGGEKDENANNSPMKEVVVPEKVETSPAKVEEQSPSKEVEEFAPPPTVPAKVKPFLPKLTTADIAALKNNPGFTISYDEKTGERILERTKFKKWCCERCPYATAKRGQFERHLQLHGCKQTYVCDFCDYSVPTYNLLLQHKRLHLLPNPNLLSVQSITNLQHLPEATTEIALLTELYSADKKNATVGGIHDNWELYENTAQFTEPKKLYRCDRCPYTNVRRDHLLQHLKFHMIPSDLKCPYCDYSVSKQHLLLQHVKVHFCSGAGDDLSQLVDSEGLVNGQVREAANEKARAEPPETKYSETGRPIRQVRAAKQAKEAAKESEEEQGVEIQLVNGVMQIKREAASQDGRSSGSSTPAAGEAESPETVWICQYCDRAFHASEQLLRHEIQHLVGSQYQATPAASSSSSSASSSATPPEAPPPPPPIDAPSTTTMLQTAVPAK